MSTVHRCVHNVAKVTVQHLFPSIVKWPSQNISDVPQRFMQLAHLPRVAGCVDGTLIPMDAPQENEAAYVDRHGKHSLNCLVVCGPDLQFYYASARWPGSVSDARVLRNSSLARTWENGWRPFPN